MSASLNNLVGHLADDPRFLAGWLGDQDQDLARRLRLDEVALQRLLLCKAPAPSRFAADVVAIAEYVGVDALDLAGALREASAYAALRSRPAQVGLLAAARDREIETFRARASTRVARAVDDFWSRVPTGLRSREVLERIAPLALPVAVVPLPKLRLSRAKTWLAERGLELPLSAPDQPLRGLLLSWRGLSLLLVDGGLDAADRRVTVAHEIGHIVLDYLEGRALILRQAPSLLGVVDGHRRLTADERIRAALEGVPLGIQAHLLPRDASGAAPAPVDAAERDASVFALELLAPEEDVVEMLRGVGLLGLPFDEALDRAASVVGREFELPPDEARARARGALAALGKGRGFFEE